MNADYIEYQIRVALDAKLPSNDQDKRAAIIQSIISASVRLNEQWHALYQKEPTRAALAGIPAFILYKYKSRDWPQIARMLSLEEFSSTHSDNYLCIPKLLKIRELLNEIHPQVLLKIFCAYDDRRGFHVIDLEMSIDELREQLDE